MRPFSTFLFLCAMFLSYGGLKAAATVPAAADVADSIPGRWQYISENMQTLPVDDSATRKSQATFSSSAGSTKVSRPHLRHI